METPTIYVQSKNVKKPLIQVEKEDAHYLKNVLKLKIGNKIFVKTFANLKYHTCIKQINTKKVLLKILSHQKIILKNNLKEISLFLSLVKSTILASIVAKITELGVHHFYPIETSQSNLRIQNFNLKQYEKIALTAIKQSGRENPLMIYPPKKIEQLKEFKDKFLLTNSINLLAYENSSKEIVFDTNNKKNINLFVGPEGGISLIEKSFLENLNFRSISLSKNILRVETAVLFLLAKIL